MKVSECIKQVDLRTLWKYYNSRNDLTLFSQNIEHVKQKNLLRVILSCSILSEEEFLSKNIIEVERKVGFILEYEYPYYIIINGFLILTTSDRTLICIYFAFSRGLLSKKTAIINNSMNIFQRLN
jgi:hypothetical protein